MPDVVERRISLAEFHAADEVFTTGTMGELTPVNEIDGRKIYYNDRPGDLTYRPVLAKIAAAYRQLTEEEGEPVA
jgi:protein-lysine N-methyltransferase EEF2KMT